MSDQQYWAQLDENDIVIDVAVVSEEFMKENPDRYPGRWVETYIDDPNKTYAGVGYTYDEATDDFIPPPAPPPPPPAPIAE